MSLNRVWRQLTGRPTGDSDDRADDLLAAGVMFVVGLVLTAVGLTDQWSSFTDLSPLTSPWWHVLPLTAGCVLMTGKRAHPFLALAGGVLVVGADLYLGGSVAVVIVLGDLLYSAVRYSGPLGFGRLRTGIRVGLALVAVLIVFSQGLTTFSIEIALQLVAFVTLTVWWGTEVRQKSDLALAAQAKADLEHRHRLDGERIAELDRRDAIQRERSAIARDLHDVVAGHLTAIALHTEAALQTPAVIGGALPEIRQNSLAALREMRSMIAVLHSDPENDPAGESGSPSASKLESEKRTTAAVLTELDALVSAARATGSNITIATGQLPELSAATHQAGYRICQEALTNAAKHAPGQRIEIQIQARPNEIVVTISNDVTNQVSPASGVGYGMIGMQERARAVGGTMTAGVVGDQWQVQAELPVAEEPVAEFPVAEEPVAEEPVAELPAAELPAAEEIAVVNR